MRLIFKNGMSYLVGDGYYPEEDLRVKVDIPKLDLKTHKLIVKINQRPSVSVKREFLIPLEELRKPDLNIAVSVKDLQNGKITEYPMDKLNVRREFLFGDNMVTKYPAEFQRIREVVEKNSNSILIIMKAIKELEERGEIL